MTFFLPKLCSRKALQLTNFCSALEFAGSPFRCRSLDCILNSVNRLNSLTIFSNDILLASKFLCMLTKAGHYPFNGYIVSDSDLSRQGIMASYVITYMHDSRVNCLLQAVLKEPLRAGRT